MKHLFTILIAILTLSGQAFSQAGDMTWGPEIKLKGSLSFIGEHEGNAYALRYYKRDVFLEKYDIESMENLFSFAIDISQPNSKKAMGIEHTYLLDGNISIIASYYDKQADANILKGLVFTETGDVVKDWMELASFNAKSKRNTGGYDIVFSPDKKQLLVAANTPYEKKGNERYLMYLFDNQLNKKWEKEFVLPYTDDQTSIYDFQLDNNGVAHMLASISPKTRKEKKQARKAKEDTKKQLLVTYNGEKDETTEFELQLKNKTIISATLRLDTLNRLILAGFYSDNIKKRGALSGVFYTRIQAGASEPEVINTHEFDKKFVEKLIGKRRAKKGQEISTNFILRQLVPTADGGLVAIAEQFYIVEHCRTNSNGVRTCTYTYHYNDIIVVGINNEGEIAWSNVINKTSSDGSYGYYLSYGTFIGKDKIQLVFLDNKKNFNQYGERMEADDLKSVNVRKSVAAVATISMDGKIEYSVLYDSKEMKVYMRPKISKQLNDRNLIVLGQAKKRGRVRLGRVDF